MRAVCRGLSFARYNPIVPLEFKSIRMMVAIVLCCAAMTGCVRRTITITSEPSGALVWLNSREIGRTPVTVDFLYYGVYDVQLVAEGYEPLLTTGTADAPWWDNVPLDIFAEITPGEKESHIEWHYVMTPRNDDPVALLERAKELRSRVDAAPPNPPGTVEDNAAPANPHPPPSN